MFRTALLILSGNMLASILIFTRNLLIARLIPLEDYGIAATFAIILAVIEMSSQLGLRQQIVQSKQGDDEDFQAALQGFQVLRGWFAAVLLLLLGGLLADLMGMPEVAWAYRTLALVPFFNAMQHFDIFRMNRQMKFLPGIMVRTVPVAITLALSWPLAVWLNDYRVMLYVIILQSVLATAMSHLVAQRRWRIRLDTSTMAGALKFGWPLLVNNILLFLVFNGDRIVVGRELGATDLAIFSMGITLTLTPTLVFARSIQSFYLPQLSKIDVEGRGRDHFAQLSTVVIEMVLVASLVFTLGVALVGAPVAFVLLGDKYLDLLPYMTLFAIVQGLRMLKIGPAIVALSVARTANALIGNITRVVTLPLAWWAATTTGDLRDIILIMVGGELVGCILVLAVLWRQVPLHRGELLLSHAAGLLLIGAVTAVALQTPALHTPTLPGWHVSLFLCLSLVPAVLAMPTLRRYVWRKVKR